MHTGTALDLVKADIKCCSADWTLYLAAVLLAAAGLSEILAVEGSNNQNKELKEPQKYY